MSGSNNNTNSNNIPVTLFKEEVVYKECLHNHAASLGKVATDGCYEFLQSTIDDAVDGEPPKEMAAFLCAVCNCHRNFHRKKLVYTPINMVDTETIFSHYHHNHHQPNSQVDADVAAVGPARSPPKKQKKERTKFSEEQVRRLVSFAERLGWRSRRADKELIHNFCADFGISHRIFVVWLNNNRRRVLNNNNNNNEEDHHHHDRADDDLMDDNDDEV